MIQRKELIIDFNIIINIINIFVYMIDTTDDKRIKILVLGHVGSGKTNLLLRYFTNKYEQEYQPTNGSHMANRKFNYKKSQLDVEVLEIGGHSINSLIPQTFHGILSINEYRYCRCYIYIR